MNGLFNTLGNLVTGHGFGDEIETFRKFAGMQPNLLNVFPEDEQRSIGRSIQQAHRTISTRPPSFEQINKFISDTAAARQQQQAAQEQATQLRSLLGGGVSPQQMPQGGPQQMPAAGGAQPMPVGMPAGMGAAGPQMPQGSPDVQAPPMGPAAASMGQQQLPGPAAMSVQEARKATAERYRKGAEYLITVGREKDAKVLFDKAKELDPTENFLAPVAGRDRQGNEVFFQPGNLGGQRTMEGVAPPPPETPSDVRAVEYLTGGPGSLARSGQAGVQQVAQYREQLRPQVTVNNNPSPPDKGSAAFYETLGKALPGLQSQASSAARTNESLRDMIDLGNRNTFSGMLAPGAIGASQFFQSLGVPIAANTLSNTREFQANSNILVLDFMGAMGGARGFSKEESAILFDAFPKIIDSPAARERIARMLITRNNRIIEEYKTMREQFESGGGKLPPMPTGMGPMQLGSPGVWSIRPR